MVDNSRGSNKVKDFLTSNTFLAILTACLVTISLLIWRTQKSRNLAQIATSTESRARFYASETEVRFTSTYEALERLASQGGSRNVETIEASKGDAAFYIEAFEGIKSIAWVDENFRIQWIVPIQGNASYLNKHANQIPEDPSHLNLSVPSYNGTDFEGYVLGIIEMETFISPIIREINNNYMLKLSSEGTTIFESDNWKNPPQEFIVIKSMTFEKAAVLRLSFAPTKERLDASLEDAGKVLAFSLFISTLTIVAVYFAQNYNAIAILNELRYRNLFESSRDAIFIINVEEKCQGANPAALELVGFSLAELQEMTIDDLHLGSELLSPDFRSQLWTEGGMLEITLLHKEGKMIPAELMISPIREGGDQKYVLGIARDITDRIKAERKLAGYRDHLEELVDLRTTQLEAINQELTNFAYVVSHDLKAPLRGIIQLSKWIADDYAEVLDEEGQEMLDLLEKRTLRMHNLIQGILEYSRIGRVKEKEKKIDLNQLIDDMVNALAPPDHIRIRIEDELPAVYGEPTRLLQVFQNLVENAVKYIDKEKGDVRIDCVDKGSSWQFEISDNGPGIEEKYYGKIFNMFQTLSSRDQVDNTGVGLALVKKIVKGWAGEVWVESELDRGSTFYFTIPKSQEKQGAFHEKQ